MRWLQTVARDDPEMQELMRENARTLVYTVAGLYFIVHVIGTVGFPHIFSPSLWLLSVSMVILVALTLHLLKRHYFLSQLLWLAGLGALIGVGYHLYAAPQVLLLWTALPLIAVASLGVPVTAICVVVILIAVGVLLRFGNISPSSLLGKIFHVLVWDVIL